MRIYDSVVKLIEELDPGIVVVDILFNAGFDACYSLNREFVISNPTAPTEAARQHHPWLKGLWYYPVFVVPSNLPVPNLGLTFSSFYQDW